MLRGSIAALPSLNLHANRLALGPLLILAACGMRAPQPRRNQICSRGPFVAEASSGVSGVSGRYASALFDLARDGKALKSVAASLETLRQAAEQSADFASLLSSPVVGRGKASDVMSSLSATLKLDALTGNFLKVLAANRRLAALPAIIRDFRTLLARHNGEVTAQVTSAQPLTAEQTDALRARLKAGLKQDVDLQQSVDPDILGGLIVKVGSRMIDSSLRTKLNSLALKMKA